MITVDYRRGEGGPEVFKLLQLITGRRLRECRRFSNDNSLLQAR